MVMQAMMQAMMQARAARMSAQAAAVWLTGIWDMGRYLCKGFRSCLAVVLVVVGGAGRLTPGRCAHVTELAFHRGS